MIDLLIHVALLLLFPPLMLGVINKTKAWFAGRVGPPVLQTYYDLAKLVRKGMVISDTTTWVFRMGPVVTLATVLLAGLLIPFGRSGAPISFAGDLILFAYLFGLARFCTTTAALDTGSAFEGMGSAREVTFACLSEPALFFAFLVLAKASGSLTLTRMLHGPAGGFPMSAVAPLVCVGIGLFVVLLAETCRIPVDDPNTHLELTMIHEVMVLDHSGRPFALVLYGASLKLLVLGALIVGPLLPRTSDPWLDWAGFYAAMGLLAVAVGLVESATARFRMNRVPQFLVAGLLATAFAFFLLQA